MKIHHILCDLGYQVEGYGILKYKDNGFYLSLSQDSEAKIFIPMLPRGIKLITK